MYLSGAKNAHITADLASGGIGLLQTPSSRYSLEGVAVWAVDNGCFTNAYPGDDAYMALLARHAAHRDRCLFVAAPDVVGDGPATLALFPPMAARIRAADWPVALVAQDGMTPDLIPWDACDWLFIGGSTEFKLGPDAVRLIHAAHRHGVRVHVGRVNSGTRFARFAALGADTCDGTYLAFGPAVNAPRLRSWIAADAYRLPLSYRRQVA